MNILCFSPHTDDAELGAGGTIARCLNKGHRVRIVAFSAGSSDPAEFHQSMRSLGATYRLLYGFKNKRIGTAPLDIIRVMEQELDAYWPDAVFAPASCDVHQDHRAITRAATRVFKDVTLLGYEHPWGQVDEPFEPGLYVRLTDGHIQAKIDALSNYKSQQDKLYLAPETIDGLARVRGSQIRARYAEAFEVIRCVVE